MKNRIALLLGASGSVGSALLQELLANDSYEQVIAFVRKPLPHLSSKKLSQKVVGELTPATIAQAVQDTIKEISSDRIVSAFSALGVGAKTAKLTIDEHRGVDVQLNEAFAKACASRVNFMALLSSVGANPKAKATGNGAAGMSRYLRVKGESEEAVKASGAKAVGIFRPAMIRGSQHTPKVFDWIAPALDLVAPKKYHSISTREIAQSMIAASLRDAPVSGTFEYSGMTALMAEH